MCMMVYLASDHPLPESEWDKENPAFFVTSNDQCIDDVKQNFTKQYVYYAGSHENCGCGFAYMSDEYCRSIRYGDPDDLIDALRANLQGRASIQRLREYLEMATELGPVELYAVWSGNEALEPVQRLEVDPSYFGGEEFKFEEQWFFNVHKRDGSKKVNDQ